MDLSKFITAYPDFIRLLSSRGYKQSTIEKYQWICNRLMREAGGSRIGSFEDYYLHLKESLSPKTMPEVKSYLGVLKHYLQTGRFIFDTVRKSQFMRDTSYTGLNGWYKSLVDHCMSKLGAVYSDNTLKCVKCAASVFCQHFQQGGHGSFNSIVSQAPVLEYFHDGTASLSNSAHRYYVSLFLTSCQECEPSCGRVLSFLPLVPERQKNYDYLKPWECRLIEGALSSDRLSLRDKAIGVLAYYTGLRSSDIANLRLDDFDIENGLIVIAGQVKTGERLALPLRPVVRDAVCEYVEKERPIADDDHVFLTKVVPYRGMPSGSMNNVSKKIMDAAGVRMEGGRRGLHLFRHAFASDLISKDVPRHHVSALLGHTSLSSVDSYIDADIEHLRTCALSIEPFAQSRKTDAVFCRFGSGASAALTRIRESLLGDGLLDPYTHQTLWHLDQYCTDNHPGRELTQGIVEQWAQPGRDETAKRHARRMTSACRINTALADLGLKIPSADPPSVRKRQSYSGCLISSCRGIFEDYVAFRKASSKWSQSYDYQLKAFDRYCHEHIPSLTIPDQATIDAWCVPYEKERITSCGKRVAFLPGLCKYIGVHAGITLTPPQVPTRDGSHYLPHAFTSQELRNLFIACDEMERLHKSTETLLRTWTVPAVFRLMYSSGMRTKEVRMLDCSDIDLEHGVVNISKTKGLHEHRVALHPSMLSYLKEYDGKMRSVMPGRKCFFANSSDRYYSSSWLEYNFELVWHRYNGGHVVPYDLRHHYASENIDRWPADSDTFNKNLVYLSRSMGHANIDETMYYYSHTTKMARLLMERKAATFTAVTTPDNQQNMQET